jgi:DNA-binding response OmpR family regulator
MRLLVVEDDFALSEVLVQSLRQIGYAVESIDDGMAADALLRRERFDLIVLDLGLPNLDGLDVLRRLRAKGSTTPVLILSGRDADDELVRGLDCVFVERAGGPRPRTLAAKLQRRFAMAAARAAVIRYGVAHRHDR